MASFNGTVVGERLLQGIQRWKGRQESNRSEEIVGDALGVKDHNCIRLLSQNINGLGREANSNKESLLKSFITDNGIDVMSFQQLNYCWSTLSYKNRVWDRFRGWKESHNLTVAYNTCEKPPAYFQPGGTAVLSVNKISHTWESSGVDGTNLGRWAWSRYQGSHGRHLRVVSVYRAATNSKTNSTYVQQLRYSMQHKNGVCPRELLLQDLQNEIIQWKSSGDSIVVMGDFNEDVRSPTMECWRERLGLHEALLDRIQDPLLAPPTYQRGRVPLDTIMVTAGLEIRKAGYLAFGEGVGDHRPLFIDVTIASSLGVNLPPPRSVKARRLKLGDPRVIKAYNKALKIYFSRFSLLDQIQLLQAKITYPLSLPAATEFERLDKIRIQGMKYAEKRCRKLRMGGVPWTPELTRIRTRIEVWQLVLRRLQGCLVSARTIIRKKNKASMRDTETNVTQQYAQDQIHKEFDSYKEYVNNSASKRQSFLHELAQAKASKGKLKVSTQLKVILRNEAQRASAARVRRMNGTTRTSQGLPKVIILNPDGVDTEVNDKGQMEGILLDAYEHTLTQANGTPCMRSPLRERLGLCGTGSLVDDILLGDLDSLEGVDDSTVEVLKYLSLKNGRYDFSPPLPLSVEECQEGWCKTNERIASAMSEGTHYGHWKAGHLDVSIATVHTFFANIPFQSGYTPARWKYGVNSLIPKEAGNYRVNRLRTILLYEADFNFNNKVLGRRMMQSAESHGVLASEQYGSRKMMSAIECALNKRLMFDILRQLKRSAGICSCDLQSCYDRIIHSFASVAMQRAGAPLPAIESMLATIQQLKHVVRTCHGDSTKSFGGEEWRELNPLHGVGQGNGAAPAIWAVISSVFFDLLRDKGYGFNLRAPLSKLAINLAGCGFVDDTDLLQIGLEEDDYISVTQKLQETVNWWETCARVSGGAVVPNKSWFGLVEFEWTDGEWRYATDLNEIPLLVKDAVGVETPLKLLAPDEAKRMLGVFLAIDGSNTVQIKHMRNIAEGWYDKVRTGHITREDAWRALHGTIIKTLEYPLLALTLTKEACNTIMAPVLHGGLSKMGVCKNMPRDLVYGPLKYQGLGIPNLYTTQGLSHIVTVLTHCWRGTETGKLIQTSVEIAKVEAGLHGSLWEHDYNIYSHLIEDSWVKHLWHYIWEIGATFKDTTPDFSYAREGDIALTEGFAECYRLGIITRSEWAKANKCRLYLQCLTLGDIASGDGLTITAEVLAGVYSKQRARSITWPAQGKPKSTDWATWRRLLRKCFLSGDQVHCRALGKWLPNVDTLYQESWPWWWDNACQTLYRFNGTGWYRYETITRKRTRNNNGQRFKYYTCMQRPPDTTNLHRTTVAYKSGEYIAQGFAEMSVSNPSTTPPSPTLEGLISSLLSVPGEAWAVHELMTTPDISSLIEDICTGTAVGVSDGSYKDNYGTAAWILENAAGTQRIQGKVIVPGYASDQSAYRSEVAGLYGLVFVLERIVSVCRLSTGGVTIGCDGLNALTDSITIDKCTSCKKKHFDLISGIQGYLAQSILKYSPTHVKGHQDKQKKFYELDKLARLNVECDLYAKEFWTECTANGTAPAKAVLEYTIPLGISPIYLHGTRVVKNLLRDLRESIEGGRIAAYWINKKKRFTAAGYFRVDWPAVKTAIESVPLRRRQWVSKFQSGFCATGRMMKLWRQRLIDTCPRCGAAVEQPTHILCCPSASAVTTWEKSLLRLKEWMTLEKTCPDISRLLLHALAQWRATQLVTPLTSYDFDAMPRLFIDQERIGWGNVLGGCLSVEWAAIQDSYYKWLGIKKTGLRWVSQLIQQLWNVAWDQWEDRNGIIHGTPLGDDLNGAVSLNAAIQAECTLGSQQLPPHVKRTFPQDVNTLLNAPLFDRKCWLVLVRAARELVNDVQLEDDFSDRTSMLRRWVGLQVDD